MPQLTFYSVSRNTLSHYLNVTLALLDEDEEGWYQACSLWREET
jgi:hypothetical protein